MNFEELFEKTQKSEERYRRTKFLAPVAKGGRIATSIDNLVYEFRMEDPGFEGWAVLKPSSHTTVKVERIPKRREIKKYLSCLPMLDFILTTKVGKSSTYLAYPGHQEDYKKRFGIRGEVYIHLVEDGEPFRWVKAAFDGANFWFSSIHRSRPRKIAIYLRDSLLNLTDPTEINYSGLLPEEKTAYNLAIEELMEQGKTDTERRLEKALGFADAKLISYKEMDNRFRVRWESDGSEHVTTVRKEDLTVLSAGICLDDQQTDFDLTSIVSVMKESRGVHVYPDEYYDE